MFAESERQGKLLAEAFMYRSHPMIVRIMQAVKSGAIGEIKAIRTSFCYRTTRPGQQRVRFVPRTCDGGGLMDVGCLLHQLHPHGRPGQNPTTSRPSPILAKTGIDDILQPACSASPATIRRQLHLRHESQRRQHRLHPRRRGLHRSPGSRAKPWPTGAPSSSSPAAPCRRWMLGKGPPVASLNSARNAARSMPDSSSMEWKQTILPNPSSTENRSP